MHNLTVSGSKTNSRRAIDNRALESAFNNTAYRYWIQASDFTQIGSMARFVAATTTIPSHWFIADGDTDSFSFYLSRPNEWRAGYVYVNIHWSSSVANNAARWLFDAHPVTDDAVFSATSATGFNVTANATANALSVSKLTDPSSTALTSSNKAFSGIHVLITQDGTHAGDTNTGDKSFYGVELVYQESSRSSGKDN